MTFSPYDLMQMAVDIVETSPHPTNKVAATLAGDGFALSRTNAWPGAIAQKIGRQTKIGNSSGTVHAETACILAAGHPTEGASIFVTDPPCPNCVKNMAEAGITKIYIDHKGFKKDFARRRGHHFENISMQICQHAGINVYKIWRKEENLAAIWEAPEDYKPEKNPVATKELSNLPTPELFKKHTQSRHKELAGRPFAAAISNDAQGKWLFMSAARHPVIGYSSEILDIPKGKYDFLMQPISGILMSAARKGLKIEPAYFFSSIIPTSRELVNMIGAGHTQLTIGEQTKSRDEFGPKALVQLQDAKIIQI